jgi:hypothetical protein
MFRDDASFLVTEAPPSQQKMPAKDQFSHLTQEGKDDMAQLLAQQDSVKPGVVGEVP